MSAAALAIESGSGEGAGMGADRTGGSTSAFWPKTSQGVSTATGRIRPEASCRNASAIT